MTLGEKIKESRKQCGLSQEQLSEKMAISRSAVAKWETDKGLPDIENLKTLAKLLDVSIDYLLDEEEVIKSEAIREPYNIANYGKGSKKKKKDRVIRDRFPDAEIYTVIGKPKLTKSERIIDNVLGFFTDAPFGTPDLINSFKNIDKEFYFVLHDDKQFLVTVTSEVIETRRLLKQITSDKFEIDGWQYIKCKHAVK